MPAVAVHRLLIVGAPALQRAPRLLLCRFQNALRDLDILEWQVELLGIELLGSGAEPLAAQLADEALQPPLRLDGIRQRRLCLGEARLQAFVLLSEGGVIHA